MFKFFKKNSTQTGFTLIELLVVIAIIGVLASIVLASLNNARRKSRDSRRITDIKQVQLALELYFDGQSNQYPLATAVCDATANARGLEVLVSGGYIPQVPRDPSSNTNCYLYASSANRLSYHIGTTLEETTNPALNGDKDCTSAAVGCGTAAYTSGFAGTDPIYDVTP